MNSLTWHIVKKDFRHLRWYLAIWWAALVASALDVAQHIQWIFGQNLENDTTATDNSLTMFYWFLVVVDVVMLAVVVDGILKGDSPIDERACWRTRPVGKGRMFRAKLASIALFCFVLPGAIQTFGRMVFGYDANEFLHGQQQFLLLQGGIVALVACAALLFQRTITGLLTFVGLFIASVAIPEVMFWFVPAFKAIMIDYVVALDAAWDEHLGMIMATVVVVAAVMYAGQRRRAGWLALAGGLLFNWAVGLYSDFSSGVDSTPWVDGPWVDMGPTNIARNDTIKLSIEPRPEVDKPSDASFQLIYKDRSRVYGWINNPSFPEAKDSVWRIWHVSSHLSWPGSNPEPANFNSAWGQDPGQLINAPAAFAAAGYGRLAWEPVGTWRNFPIAALDQHQLDRVKKEPAQLSANIYLASDHLERIADLPATTNATWHDGMSTMRLRTVDFFDGSVATLVLDKISPWHLREIEDDDDRNAIFLLYNARTQECIEATADPGFADKAPGFTWRRLTVRFTFQNKTDVNGQKQPDLASQTTLEQWLANAHLVELKTVQDQSFYCPVTIDHFLLPETKPVLFNLDLNGPAK